MALYELGATSNLIPSLPTDASCVPKKCVSTLNEIPMIMGELAIHIDFLVLEDTLFNTFICLPSMILLRAPRIITT